MVGMVRDVQRVHPDHLGLDQACSRQVEQMWGNIRGPSRVGNAAWRLVDPFQVFPSSRIYKMKGENRTEINEQKIGK